jgi:3-phosphoshikimate 1-carboxyvinyltransferase
MTSKVLPGPITNISSSVSIPTSKSLTNRALIAAAAADGGIVSSPLDCDDTRALANALETAGWSVEWGKDLEVGGRNVPPGTVHLNLGDSGTGARLILGLLAASPGSFVIDGSPRLRERPMAPLVQSLRALGATIRTDNDRLPMEIEGTSLRGGQATIKPEVSSQFVSSLVLAAPLMQQGLDLQVVGDLPSAPYLDLTEDVLRSFGGGVIVDNDRRWWRVAPGPLRLALYEVEGDWSAAITALAAVAIAGGKVELGPLERNSRQGDRAALQILTDAGLEIDWRENYVAARGPVSSPLKANLRDTPDLFPALVVVAACAPAGSVLSGLENLQHKESDRLTVMVRNLGRLGAGITVRESEVEVHTPLRPTPGPSPKVTAAADHRVAMAMALAALFVGPLELDDPDCVSKSFPDFWPTWARLIGAEAG